MFCHGGEGWISCFINHCVPPKRHDALTHTSAYLTIMLHLCYSSYDHQRAVFALEFSKYSAKDTFFSEDIIIIHHPKCTFI